ncbi:Mpo1-like protein [Azospirillum sp. sgz301742]
MGAFWPEYLAEHRNPVNRALHVTGTVLATGLLVAGAVRGDWRLLVAAPLAGYGFAWFGHFVVEKNRPKTFEAPLKSLAGDFRMAGLALCGRLGREMKRQGVASHPHPSPPPLGGGGN